MNKNILKGMVIGFSLILLSIIGMYLGLTYYYGEGFSYGTWVNGIYCTGKSVNQINEELLSEMDYQGLTITAGDSKSYVILPEDISLRLDYTKALELYLERQNPYLWIDNLIGKGGEKELSPEVLYDPAAFEKILKETPFFQEENKYGQKDDSEYRVAIEKGEKGYYLINERVHVFEEEKAREAIEEAIETLQETLDLEEEGCYLDLALTEEMKQTIALFEKLDAYQDCRIVYLFGEEQVPVDSGVACDFVLLDEAGKPVLDEDGNLMTDEEKISAFIDHLGEEYDTVGGVRQFQATRGEVVTVEGGIYGNKLDREAEKEYLLNAFLEKREEIHTPSYTQMARCQGKDDIGTTYIEVDMTNQMMYYYVDGKLEIETPVVTGNTSLRRGTPEGTNYVYNKQRNRVLRGEDYATPVKYWIPVKGAIGIHDASWRSRYGGEIYKTNGSHGCINTPLEEVSKLYDMVEIGTPCVMFY